MPKYWVKNYFAHGRFPEIGQKQKMEKERKRDTPGTRGWSKLRDRTLAVPKKRAKNHLLFLKKNKNYLKFFFFAYLF